MQPSPTLGLGGNARPALSRIGGLPIKPYAYFVFVDNINNKKCLPPNMPVVTVSLCDAGYEGYKSIMRGLRSRVVNRMLKEYALDISQRYWYEDDKMYSRNRRTRADRPTSAAQVWEQQQWLEERMALLIEENKELRKKVKE